MLTPETTTLIGTGASLLGGLIGNGLAYENAKDTNNMNYKIAQETNETNKYIAEQNLGLQKEWNEYQKALQKEIFEREDTAYQRTASDMMSAGLNPLSMQGTNGAGQVVSTSAPQNNFQAQQSSPMQQATFALDSVSSLMAGVGSIVEQIERLKTGQLQRDELQTQINYQKLINDNLSRELGHKVDIGQYDTDMLPEKIFTHLLDWTQNGRLGKTLNFSLDDIASIFDPEFKSDIPFINDIKDMLFGSNGFSNIPQLEIKPGDTIESAKKKSSAYIKSFNTKLKKHYQQKNKEYTQRYGGK